MPPVMRKRVVFIPDEEWEWVREEAAKQEVSMGFLVRRAIIRLRTAAPKGARAVEDLPF